MDFEASAIPGIKKNLLVYRVIAWIVGVFLVLLMLVGMPLKYLTTGLTSDIGSVLNMVVGIAHGWLYMGLLVAAYLLGTKVKWPWSRLILIALGGTVPFASFVAEHFATKDVKERIAAVESAAS